MDDVGHWCYICTEPKRTEDWSLRDTFLYKCYRGSRWSHFNVLLTMKTNWNNDVGLHVRTLIEIMKSWRHAVFNMTSLLLLTLCRTRKLRSCSLKRLVIAIVSLFAFYSLLSQVASHTEPERTLAIGHETSLTQRGDLLNVLETPPASYVRSTMQRFVVWICL